VTDLLTSPLDALLADGAVRSLYQPIVDLASRAPLAFEALSRGPEGSALERPDRLFGAARAEGRVHELDVLCQTTAIGAAVAGGLGHPQWLFLNAEPETLGRTDARLIDAYAEAARATLPLVIEVTERSVTASPAELLRALEQVRATGARIAMDDIGADARALALLPLVRPDVIKLDLRLVQQQPSRGIARIVNAVNAEAERTGAVILAEGIETEEHLATALALGATLGQGWLFGRPEALPPRPARPVGPAVRPVAGLAPPVRTPFERCAEGRPVRVARKRLLIEMSKHLENEALGAGELGVLLSTFQEARNLTPDTVRRYRGLADELAFVAALGAGLPTEPVPGVRGALLHPDDPVRGEWDIVALGPHFAAALTARDLGDTGPDPDRRFEFVLTYDRDRVLASARALFERVWAEQGPDDGDAVVDGDVDGIAAVVAAEGGGSAPLVGLSELHLRALDATASGVTIASVEPNGHPLVYVNEGFERLTGYRAEDILGRDCRFLQGPGTDPAAVRRLSDAVRSRRGGRARLINYRADGTEWWNDIALSPVRDAAGDVTHIIGVQTDVTAEVAAEARLHHLAFHDELTDLPNRRALFDALVTELDRATRTGRAAAVAFIDLDGFKAVNDLAGHDQGDEVLVEVAARLRAAVREGDVVARQHGDEFVLLLTDLAGDAAGAVGAVADDLLGRLAEPIAASRGPVQVSASIGVAVAPEDGADPDAVLRAADRAMAEAKLAGKATVRFASGSRYGVAAGTPDPRG
jgi:diguanylate cyclase (GGDEF)-like protein/PAS domain S-box-containing protein